MSNEAALQKRIEELERKLAESEQTIRALGSGEIDALVRDGGSTPVLLQAAQDKLRANEQLLRAVFDSAMDAMLIANDSGAYVDANPAACALFGLSKDQLVGRRIAAFSAPGYEARESWTEFLGEGRSRGEFPLLRPDGERRDLEYSAVANVLPDRHLSILRDVTERNATELAYRLTSERLRAVISNAPLVLFAFDRDGIYTMYEGKGIDLLRRKEEDRIGRSVFETFGLLVDAEPAIRRALAGEIARWEGDTRGGFYEAILIPVFDSVGEVESVTGLGIDVNARKLAEAELRASELRYRRIVDNASEGIWMYDASGITTFMNPQMAKLLGYSVEEVIGQPIFAFMDQSVMAEARARVARRKSGKSERGRLRLRRRDGTDLWVSLQADPLFDAAGNFESALALATDITDQLNAEAALERSEEQLRQAQKMEAIGSLAGGVAHDFNNLLSVILSYAELSLADSELSESLRVDLTEIRNAGLRATVLTRQLLAFSRQQVLKPSVIELNEVLVSVEKMLARLLGEHIEISLQMSSEGGNVHADPGQLEQVIINLSVNARDAMPNGGQLIMETRNVVVEKNAPDHVGIAAGSYVVLSITDTGTGMDEATQQRIFEPFFTTKSEANGTGLGLSMVYGIVKQSGGHIDVVSTLGKGTTFNIYLPQTDRAVAEPQLQVASTSTLEGSETILLVEDEEQVRIIMRSILRKHGYRILEAQNGGEALLVCEEFNEKIDLLVTDVVMPRMSGRRLAERLLAVRPDLGVLYVSGYTDKEILEHGLDAGVDFLQKPFTPQVLLRKVRDVLDAARPMVSPSAA